MRSFQIEFECQKRILSVCCSGSWSWKTTKIIGDDHQNKDEIYDEERTSPAESVDVPYSTGRTPVDNNQIGFQFDDFSLDMFWLKISDEQVLIIDITAVDTAAAAMTAVAVAVTHFRATAATGQLPTGPHHCVPLGILSFEDQHHLLKINSNIIIRKDKYDKK